MLIIVQGQTRFKLVYIIIYTCIKYIIYDMSNVMEREREEKKQWLKH